MSEIKRYLRVSDDWVRRANSTFTDTIFGFVLKHGRLWRTTPLLQREFRFHRGEMKQCYRNAAMAAMSDNRLTYVEGYADSIIPIPHAWCVTARGLVVELTWEKPGAEYYGVPFKTKFLREELLRNKVYGLIDAWQSNCPLLRGMYPKREWLKPIKSNNKRKGMKQ